MKPTERRAAFERSRLYLVHAGSSRGRPRRGHRRRRGSCPAADEGRRGSEILEIGEQCMARLRRPDVPFVINDRPDIALALAADGVHLGQDDLPPFVAREIVGPDMLIGRSTHSKHDIARGDARARGRTGRLHRRRSDLGDADRAGKPGIGLELVTHASSIVEFPWFGDRRHRPDQCRRRNGGRRDADRRRPRDHRGGRSDRGGRRLLAPRWRERDLVYGLLKPGLRCTTSPSRSSCGRRPDGARTSVRRGRPGRAVRRGR